MDFHGSSIVKMFVVPVIIALDWDVKHQFKHKILLRFAFSLLSKDAKIA